jgi:aspartate/methionine/tyrosine aminotransferase
MIEPSDRVKHVSGHFFLELNQRLKSLQAAGTDVIRLDAGTPDLPPAAHIVEALNRSPATRLCTATSLLTAPCLRHAWAEAYQRSFGVNLDVDQEVLPLLGRKKV